MSMEHILRHIVCEVCYEQLYTFRQSHKLVNVDQTQYVRSSSICGDDLVIKFSCRNISVSFCPRRSDRQTDRRFARHNSRNAVQTLRRIITLHHGRMCVVRLNTLQRQI